MEKSKRIKVITILTAIIMIVQTMLPLTSALAVKIGDANGDGKISITDLSLLKQYLVSGREDYVQAMDINSDNRITITDLSRLKLILVGQLPEPGETEEGEIEITIEPTNWTNENVRATITYPNIGAGYKKQYSLDNKTWHDYTRSVEIEQNGTLYARLLNSNDQEVTSTSKEITNIDKLAPKAFEAEIKQAVTNVVTVIGKTEDQEATEENGKSEVARYYFSQNSGTNWSTNQNMSETQYIYRNLEPNTQYGIMVRAIDGAGNTTETKVRTIKTYKSIIDILIDRGIITEEQVDRETGIITMEDGSQYKIEIKENGGYEVIYVGPEALEDLTEDEKRYQELQQEKLEEEIEQGLKQEIIDRLIEEGKIEEEQVDRETGTIEDNGIIYDVEIKEDGTYEIVEVGTVEEVAPVVVYTVEPKEATKIATIEIIAKGKNITKAILPTGETKTYSNVEEIREEVQVSANGKYTVKVTGNGKETEKTIIVTNIIETPEIQIEATTTEPTNLTEPMKVIITYGKTLLTNNNKYEYQIEKVGQKATPWIAAEKVQEITVETNMTVRARYNDGTNGLAQKEIVINNVDTTVPDAYEMNIISTDNSIRITASTEDRANEGAGENIAGIEKIEYKLEEGEWQTSSTFTNLQANRAYKVYSRAIDKAGNIREANNSGIAVKTKREGDTGEITVSMNTTNWTKENVRVYLSAEGSQKIYYQEHINTGEWQEYKGRIEIEENMILYAKVENGREQEIEITNIDKLAPQAFSPEVIEKDPISITVTAYTEDAEETEGLTTEEREQIAEIEQEKGEIETIANEYIAKSLSISVCKFF